jgi:hypothetical protein
VRAGNRAGFDVTVATNSWCPFAPLRVERDGTPDRDCTRFSVRTVRNLIQRRPSLVIVAARTDAYIERRADALGAVGSSTVTNNARAKARLWRQAVASTLGRLNRAGIPVVLVHPVPALPHAPNACAVVLIIRGTCTSSVPRAAADARLQRSVRAEDAAVAATPASTAISVENEICGPTRCSSTRAGVVQYRDDLHLSIDGALQLTDRFYAVILAHARARARGGR